MAQIKTVIAPVTAEVPTLVGGVFATGPLF